MEIRIKTLTPIWTGGIEPGRMDRIHETGILGSLRWWYEAIVRGLGGYACDPSTGACRFDAEAYGKSQADDERQRLRDAGLCDVCQVFGATGWRRRFRLTVEDDTKPDPSVKPRIKANRSYTDIQGRTRTPTWYFPDEDKYNPRSGNLTLQIHGLAPDFEPEVIGGLIQFITDWSALGARPQMGFGVVELLDGPHDTRPFYEHIIATAGNQSHSTFPSLKNMFFARIAPLNSGSFSNQDTFNIKYDIRRLFASDDDLRHFIMGTVKGQRMAAKVKMSRPYNNGREIRVWGWIPEEAKVYSGAWNRDAVVSTIYDHLKTKYKLEVWREMNSSRDTVTPNNADALAFLRDLLAIGEEDDAA